MATEKSLQDMLKERQALEKQIAAKRKAERKAVVDQVRQLCKDYEITYSEMRTVLKTRGKKDDEEGAKKAPTKSRATKTET